MIPQQSAALLRCIRAESTLHRPVYKSVSSLDLSQPQHATSSFFDHLTNLIYCHVCFLFRVRLGNHTKRIADYSEKCASENRQALIRVDGPYGNLTFNYRRYGSLVLVGGGIGITPIISIIKDIYEKGEVKRAKNNSHCMKIVHLLWIVPFEADAALFLDQLLIYRELSTHEPSLPPLEVSIHVTREESMSKIESGPIFYSKPDFPLMMNECTTKAVEASSSSILIFACGPGRYVTLFLVLISSSLCYMNLSTSLFLPYKHSMVNQVWDASMKKNSKHIRVDFHHESFAF